MAKKKPISKKVTKSQPKVAPKPLSLFVRSGISLFTLVLMGGLVYFLLFSLNEKTYEWMRVKLIKGNLEWIADKPDMKWHEKSSAKLGWNHYICQIIKDKTPEDAVILLPPLEERDKYNADQEGNKKINYLWSQAWVTYYLYPRRFVYAHHTDDPRHKDVTHVAIFNYWGYDKLNYQPRQRTNFTALPINEPQK